SVATHFRVSAPAGTTAGAAFTVTVTALDASNNPVGAYTGTVHFSSADAQALLPADYQFTATDGGVHAFTVVLKTAGGQTVNVTDTAAATVTGGAVVAVSPAGVASLTFLQQPLTGQSQTP